jgi:hypothetical protein
MIGGAAMTSLMLPLSGDLLERQRLLSNASAKHTGRCIEQASQQSTARGKLGKLRVDSEPNAFANLYKE